MTQRGRGAAVALTQPGGLGRHRHRRGDGRSDAGAAQDGAFVPNFCDMLAQGLPIFWHGTTSGSWIAEHLAVGTHRSHLNLLGVSFTVARLVLSCVW